MLYRKLIKGRYTDDLLTSVSMLYNGSYIENQIEGYKTLNVYGREMQSFEVDMIRRTYTHGSIRFDKSLPPRIIDVEYRLISKSSEEQEIKYDKLKSILYTDNVVPIVFKDEPDYTYYGEYQSSEKVNTNTLNIVSSFSIICYDPHKYGKEITTSGSITVETRYKTYPTLIKVSTSSSVSSMYITNGRQYIRLKGVINSGSRVEIDVINQTLKVNGQVRNDLIDLASDFENFEIKKGQTVRTNNGSVTVIQREVKL